MNTTIPALTIEENDDGTLTLEQDWCGQVDRIAIHPLHVRHLAERLGLIPAGDPFKVQDCTLIGAPPAATLARRLHVLRERIRELDGRLWAVPVFPPGSASDDPDLWYSDATVDIADEFCADLPPIARLKSEPCSEPTPAAANGICHPGAMADASHELGTAAAIPPETGALNDPKNGPIQSPQMRGDSLFE